MYAAIPMPPAAVLVVELKEVDDLKRLLMNIKICLEHILMFLFGS